jgi:hypothetical protein
LDGLSPSLPLAVAAIAFTIDSGLLVFARRALPSWRRSQQDAFVILTLPVILALFGLAMWLLPMPDWVIRDDVGLAYGVIILFIGFVSPTIAVVAGALAVVFWTVALDRR